jgi:hypothetical protein
VPSSTEIFVDICDQSFFSHFNSSNFLVMTQSYHCYMGRCAFI